MEIRLGAVIGWILAQISLLCLAFKELSKPSDVHALVGIIGIIVIILGNIFFCRKTWFRGIFVTNKTTEKEKETNV